MGGRRRRKKKSSIVFWAMLLCRHVRRFDRPTSFGAVVWEAKEIEKEIGIDSRPPPSRRLGGPVRIG